MGKNAQENGQFPVAYEKVHLIAKRGKQQKMYCSNCGTPIPKEAKFCSKCGNPVSDKIPIAVSGSVGEAQSVVRKASPAKAIIVMVGVFLALIFAVNSFISFFSAGLTGSYITGEYFPVNTLTFYEDGQFEAVSYNGYTETHRGKYRRGFDGKYSLKFTSGSADGGSPVTQYEASSIGNQMELRAEKLENGTLRVEVIPKISYWAWGGQSVIFYVDGSF